MLRGVYVVGTYSLDYEATVTFKVLRAVKLYGMVLFMTSDVLIHEYCNRTNLKSNIKRNVINMCLQVIGDKGQCCLVQFTEFMEQDQRSISNI
jgi:hypothetical protein